MNSIGNLYKPIIKDSPISFTQTAIYYTNYSRKREKRRPGSFQKSRKISINLGKESVRKDS